MASNNYKINGTVVPAPNTVTPEDEELTRSYRDASGIMRNLLIRRFKSVKWKYDCASKTEMDTIMGIIKTVLETNKTINFTITFEFPGEGFITQTMYMGSPTTFTSVNGTAANGIEHWTFELYWVDKNGIKINSPTGTAS